MAELSAEELQQELASFDDDIAELNTQLEEAYAELAKEKLLVKRVGARPVDERYKSAIFEAENALIELECQKDFVKKNKMSREMMEQSGKKFEQERSDWIQSLAESVVADKNEGKDIKNHNFYKFKFFFGLYNKNYKSDVEVEKGKSLFYYGKLANDSLGDLPKEIYSLASQEQVENLPDEVLFKGWVAYFGEKLQYLDKFQVENMASFENFQDNALSGTKWFLSNLKKENVNFPPNSPIAQKLKEFPPKAFEPVREPSPAMETLGACCEIC